MRITLVVPSARRPVGGATVLFELATALASRSHDVQVVHLCLWDRPVTSTADMPWYAFPESVSHWFPSMEDFQSGRGLPDADVLIGYSPGWDLAPRHGLPVVPIQGHGMLAEAVEREAYLAPCPKLCVARWLVDVGIELGVPARELVHLPPGLRHDKYRITRPVDDRPPRIAYCYNGHVAKRAPLAFAVLDEVKRTMPQVEAVVFTSAPPAHPVPPWVTVRTDPPQVELVDDIYNGSGVFLCTSQVEGFGMPCIEAMACGAALVTTDNGGSRDYAVDAETALVSTTGDVDGLARHVRALLADDSERLRLAAAGADHVRRFDWDRTGDILDALIHAYVEDPGAYGRASADEGGHRR